ncbi:MAG TPA: hypothetical protein PK616_05270, partial [Fibrobacteraceae bacterium]|nr:hypothetical protein [Fibrobacteraceae bacterium]
MIFSFKMALHFKLSIFVLLCFSSLFAVEKIDCIDPEGEYDQRCIYVAIGDVKGINLFVVETGMSLVRKNALPNEDFYVFHPTVESSNALFPKDSLRVSLINESSKDSLLTTNNNPVNSGPDSIVTLKVVADYATYNSPVGTAIKGSDANIVRIYNFYVPVLKYFDKDGKAISEETILSGEVGSEIEIEVRAVIPIGPKTQQLDSSINDKDFFIHVPSSSPLGFYNDKGESLNLNDSTVLIKLFNGSTNIIVKADKAVDGADFKVEGYPRETSTGT